MRAPAEWRAWQEASPGLREDLAHLQRLASLGRLTSGIAHEMSNPLSVIVGFAQSLLRHPAPPEEWPEALKAIEREAVRCKRLAQDLLAFCRSGPAQRVVQDPVAATEGALAPLQAQADLSRVKILRRFTAGLPWISIDRHQWQQVLINLGLNAIDAMPEGGVLTFEMKPARSKENALWLELRVQDTGVGIEPEIQDRIFEPFFTTKKAGKGTGIGLALVDQILKEHGGTIQVSSEAGRGTVFTVRMPGREPPPGSASPDRKASKVLEEVGDPDV